MHVSVMKTFVYTTGLICIASILDLLGEPFWVISQVYMYIKFRASVEFFFTLTRAVIMAVAVYVNPESAILAWGWSTLIVSFSIGDGFES